MDPTRPVLLDVIHFILRFIREVLKRGSEANAGVIFRCVNGSCCSLLFLLVGYSMCFGGCLWQMCFALN